MAVDTRFNSAYRLTLQLPATMRRPEIEKLRDLLKRYHDPEQGELEVQIVVASNGSKKVAKTFRVAKDKRITDELASVVGSRAMKYS